MEKDLANNQNQSADRTMKYERDESADLIRNYSEQLNGEIENMGTVQEEKR